MVKLGVDGRRGGARRTATTASGDVGERGQRESGVDLGRRGGKWGRTLGFVRGRGDLVGAGEPPDGRPVAIGGHGWRACLNPAPREQR